MDRLHNGAYGRKEHMPDFETGSGIESRGQRLQKKKSNPTVRNASQPLPSAYDSKGANGAGYVREGEAGKARKGSLRHAVKRIFGRRSKTVDPPPVIHASPPRHGYHRSEPPLVQPPAELEAEQEQEKVPHRTLSAPLQIVPPSMLDRNRSPYAVEFPHSARLKPLNLGNPFTAPGSQLRRRKTLPSLLIPDNDAAHIASAVNDTPEASRPSSPETAHHASTPPINLNIGTIRNPKRKSRSAGDLKRPQTTEQSPPRDKRSEELRFWRESFQGHVLRASGLTTGMLACEEQVREHGQRNEDRSPTPTLDDPFQMRASQSETGASTRALARHGQSLSVADVGSLGTEMSRDLEDRVAKLEAGLQRFQHSLQRLTNDRNRRTVIMGHGRSPSGVSAARTPSMLADTLADFAPARYAPAAYDFDFGESFHRPSTSPQPPRQPQTPPPHMRSREAVGGPRPAVPPLPRTTSAEETSSSSSPPRMTELLPPEMTSSADGGASNGASQPLQQHTFKSLYEMLSDERSARRKLEMQLRNMRQEISDLQYQVSAGSHVQSQRSSVVPLDHMPGTSRLRDLLRGIEPSPPRYLSLSDARLRPHHLFL